MSRSNFLWAFRLCIALFISGVLPVDTAQSLTYAQAKKKNPAQAVPERGFEKLLLYLKQILARALGVYVCAYLSPYYVDGCSLV